MEIVKVENLNKIYGTNENKVIALDDINFSIDKGDFVVILGASGSGKSTLLHLLGGVDRPTKGKVYIDGVDIFGLNDDELAIFRRKNVGLIYQFFNLIPILNVAENISLPADLDKRNIDKKEMDNLLNMVGLEKRKDHLPSQLSGGQEQRVAIARALVNKPALILADEPTGNLDSNTTKEILELFKMCNEKYNQTLVIITHNLEVAKIAKRIIKLKDGKIISDERK